MTFINLPHPFPGFPNFNPNPVIGPGAHDVKPVQDKKSKKAYKPGKNGTHIRFILDESSSMNSVWDKTIEGFNAYLTEQKQNPTKCNFTLSKFNGSHTNSVISKQDIAGVPALNKDLYRPSGSTNLYDAIGDAITEIDNDLRALKKKERPAVLITIMTDGEENCSTRYTQSDIKEMISTREELGWIFIYLGANQNAWAVGQSFGVRGQNTMSYDVGAIDKTIVSLASSTSVYRSAMASGQSAASYSADGFFADRSKDSKEGK